MFAGELRKQKALFAAADAIALAAAFVGALTLYDPSRSIANRLVATDPWVLGFGVIILSALWLKKKL